MHIRLHLLSWLCIYIMNRYHFNSELPSSLCRYNYIMILFYGIWKLLSLSYLAFGMCKDCWCCKVKPIEPWISRHCTRTNHVPKWGNKLKTDFTYDEALLKVSIACMIRSHVGKIALPGIFFCFVLLGVSWWMDGWTILLVSQKKDPFPQSHEVGLNTAIAKIIIVVVVLLLCFRQGYGFLPAFFQSPSLAWNVIQQRWWWRGRRSGSTTSYTFSFSFPVAFVFFQGSLLLWNGKDCQKMIARW